MAKAGGMLGKWAFLIGILLAIIVGLFGSMTSTVLAILLIIGVVVGLLNIASKEATPFLLAAISLVLVAALGKTVFLIDGAVVTYNIYGWILNPLNVLNAIMALVVPATIIVVLREVFQRAAK